MEKRLDPHVACSRTDTHPFVLGDIYTHTHTEWLVILVGLEHKVGWGWSVEFIRLHDWRTFYATYTALEWRTHWTRMTQ